MSTLERLKESSVRRSTVHQVIPVEKVEADGLNGENFFNQSWNYLEGLDGKRAPTQDPKFDDSEFKFRP